MTLLTTAKCYNSDLFSSVCGWVVTIREKFLETFFTEILCCFGVLVRQMKGRPPIYHQYTLHFQYKVVSNTKDRFVDESDGGR